MREWRLSAEVRRALDDYGVRIRCLEPNYLYRTTTFYRTEPGDVVDWLLDGKWGFTMNEHAVCMTDEFFEQCRQFPLYCAKIFHELVHVAQMRNEGLWAFRRKYFWQWIRSGFSYQRMKKRGYEQEALEYEELIYRRIQGLP